MDKYSLKGEWLSIWADCAFGMSHSLLCMRLPLLQKRRENKTSMALDGRRTTKLQKSKEGIFESIFYQVRPWDQKDPSHLCSVLSWAATLRN
jgi:hypothetical protein